MSLPKIRAWDKESKFMTYSDVEYFDDSVNYRFEHFTVSPDYEVVFMQSTGLKDKNDVEIFEGDILLYNKNKGDKHEQGEICEVVWRSDGCWSIGQLRFAQINSMEVLGNIYENPEILKITSNSEI